VSDIRIFLLDPPRGKVLAFATLMFDDVLAIEGFRVLEGARGSSFVGWPSRKNPDGSFRDIVYPISGEFRDQVQAALLRAFDDEKATRGQRPSRP
jgi:stage V sporulation protein G